MTLSNRQLRLVAAFAGLNILLAVVGWVALISPQRSDAATANSKAALAQSQLDALNGKSSSSSGHTKQPAIHTSDLYSLDTALPTQVDQPDLLFELNKVANASGVDLISVAPQTAQAVGAGYTVLPINLSLSGSYFNVTRFTHNLRMLVSEQHGHLIANGPLFSVTSLTDTNQNNANDAPATVGIAAYYYGVTAGATPPADTTDTTTTTTTTSGS